jgi:hypothetical protein
MSHHGEKPFPVDRELEGFMRKINQVVKEDMVGATGEFPEGKLNSADEGALQFKIGHSNDHVILDFGTPVSWIGIDPVNAVALAQSLIEHARACSKEPLIVKL